MAKYDAKLLADQITSEGDKAETEDYQRDGLGHPQPASPTTARAPRGAGGRHRFSSFGRCQIHYRESHQLQRRAIFAYQSKHLIEPELIRPHADDMGANSEFSVESPLSILRT